RTFRRLLTEGEPANRDHHDQHRRKREYRVVRDRRTHRRGTVVEPLANGCFAQAQPPPQPRRKNPHVASAGDKDFDHFTLLTVDPNFRFRQATRPPFGRSNSERSGATMRNFALLYRNQNPQKNTRAEIVFYYTRVPCRPSVTSYEFVDCRF